MLGMFDVGREAVGVKNIPHVLVKRSYSLQDGSLRADDRLWPEEKTVHSGSSRPAISSTLGILVRAELGLALDVFLLGGGSSSSVHIAAIVKQADTFSAAARVTMELNSKH